MMMRSWPLLLVGLLLVAPRPAGAHFLFVHVGPRAEGGRVAEVYFSERAEAGDPRFTAKVATTELWRQPTPGKFEPLPTQRAVDRLRAYVPAQGTAAVIGRWDYGVLARPGQQPFLLRHYPKAFAGTAAELAALRPWPQATVEIVAQPIAGGLRLTALADGQPLPGVKLHIIDADLADDDRDADDQGSSEWTPAAPGRYSIYLEHVRPVAGEQEGKRYEVIREFASLAVDWPLEEERVDAAAVELWQQAVAARATWQQFPGFAAQVSGLASDRAFRGSVEVSATGEVKVDVDEPVGAPLVEEFLRGLVTHRLRPATSGDDPPRLRFADEDRSHPLGRLLIFEGGEFASSYRVRDGEIRVVNRQFDGENMTLTVLENSKNAEGLLLPQRYVATYWSDPTGALARVETVEQQWIRLDRWDLPARHQATTVQGPGMEVRRIEFKAHRLLATATAAK